MTANSLILCRSRIYIFEASQDSEECRLEVQYFYLASFVNSLSLSKIAVCLSFSAIHSFSKRFSPPSFPRYRHRFNVHSLVSYRRLSRLRLYSTKTSPNIIQPHNHSKNMSCIAFPNLFSRIGNRCLNTFGRKPKPQPLNIVSNQSLELSAGFSTMAAC